MRLIDADAFKKVLSAHEMQHDKRRSFDDYSCGAASAYEHAGDLLDEAPTIDRPHGEWIPCSERLPKIFGTYLVTTEEGKVFEYDYDILTVHLKKWSYCRKEIVAWMPLPKPYEKEGEAE
jgi:hypothetical protein